MGEKTDKVRFGLTGGTIRTEILGSQRLILEGCDGIVEYGAEQIGFRCGRQQVWVRGKTCGSCAWRRTAPCCPGRSRR